MSHWVELPKIPIPDFLQDEHPLVAETLIHRGLTTPENVKAFLDPDSQPSSSPFELPGMEEAVSRIKLAMRKNEPVCIWGDFDVDGQTSTALLVQTLQILGADATYHIPIRAVSSHGVHISQLTEIIDHGTKLILTCDTGVSAHEAVDYAKSRGVDFVITDHHDLAVSLPDAVAVVNPKMLPDEHPLTNLAGVGVTYKLAEALLANTQKTELAKLLDLVALGLVVDVALLKGETRTLAQKGLVTLRNSQRTGLQLIAEFANQPLEGANEDYIGFVIGPRLNALGRLGDANPAVELLTTSDPVRARVLAAQLEGLNSQRKLLTNQVLQAAEAQLRQDPSLLEQPAIVLGHPSWPGGIVGIVASRLKDRYRKPVILLNTSEGEPARGSARSIEGLHITNAIAAQKNLLLGFGGHPMAAGLSLEQENLPAFRKKLNIIIEDMLGDMVHEEPSLQIDAWLGLDELNFEIADAIEKLAPFGAGNPTLTFASSGVQLKAVSRIGKNKEHQRLNIEDHNGNVQGILWWNSAHEDVPESGSKIDVAFSLRASTYRGERQLTLEYKDLRIVEDVAVEIKGTKIEVIDLRQNVDQFSHLNVQTYAEGEDKKKVSGVDRYGLQPSSELAIYTSPPGPSELQSILDSVKPQKVYLVSQNPEPEKTDQFLARLTGMIKFVIAKKGGKARISEMASATAQREITVRIGLEWLAAGGHVAVSPISTDAGDEDTVHFSEGSGEINQYAQKELFIAVKGLLEETAAFRLHLQSADAPALIP